MSFASLLVHTIEVWHPTFDENDVDERGQPAVDYDLSATVRGMVQPKSLRELQNQSQAGTVVSDHTIFLQPMSLSERDRLDRIVTGGRESYEIVGIRRFEFGSAPHLEVDAKRYSSDSGLPEDEEGS